MSSCMCTGACMKPGGTCSAYPNGRNCLNYPNYCSCDCHKFYGSHNCYCFCSYKKETLQLCQHGVPVKWPCSLCTNEEQKVSEPIVKWEDYQYLLKEKQILEERIGKLEQNTQTQYEHSCDGIEKLFDKIDYLIRIDGILREKIDKLEKENLMRQDTIACVDQAYNDSHLEMEKRLNKIEKFLGGDIRKSIKENVDYSDHDERIDDLENIQAEPRLIKLEEHMNSSNPLHEAHNEIHLTIDKSIRRLEKTLQELVYKDTNSNLIVKVAKKLFICDQCNGHGTVILTLVEQEILVGNPVNEFCKKCEGSGIVWG